jgi:hypothetical protein
MSLDWLCTPLQRVRSLRSPQERLEACLRRRFPSHSDLLRRIRAGERSKPVHSTSSITRPGRNRHAMLFATALGPFHILDLRHDCLASAVPKCYSWESDPLERGGKERLVTQSCVCNIREAGKYKSNNAAITTSPTFTHCKLLCCMKICLPRSNATAIPAPAIPRRPVGSDSDIGFPLA